MIVPLSWLKEYVDIDISAQELQEKLFACGFEVEELTELGSDITNVVVGCVTACELIPDTHISVCQVDAGEHGNFQVCCGADNVAAGKKYPLALLGATVLATDKNHNVVDGTATIKKGKIRGHESCGMLCSGMELGLNDDLYPGSDYFGLLELPDDAPVGADIKPLVGMDDYIFDISVTANRSDCQSILGIAREVAAFLKKPLRMPDTNFTASDFVFDGLDIQVEAPELCPRYLGHGVRNITYGQSPQWMKRRLALCGMRSISNVVDITNYVMLEIGQPMHAFDMDTLDSTKIIVRCARDGEQLTTLDGKRFQLNTSNLVICDGNKPIALAGIMGGLNSEITPQTTMLLFEAAKFVRDSVRKTSRSLGQRTDASSHYEKGISEYTCELGMARALHLIQELNCGEVTASAFDCSAGAPREGKHFTAAISGINRILGIDVPADTIVDILRNLEFTVTQDGDTLDVTAPRYREDIEIGEPDLAEEVIREYGYDHIIPTFLKDASVTNGGLDTDRQRREKIKRVLYMQGCHEVFTLSFYAESDLDALHLPQDAPERNMVRIMNPITINLSVMRTLLAPSMLNTVVSNLKRGNNEGRIFELANVYYPDPDKDKLPLELPHIGFAAFGDDEDFFTVKGIMEGLAGSLGVPFSYERAEDVPYLHPGISAYILCNGERVGVFGKLANSVAGELKLPKDSKSNNKIFLGELDYTALSRNIPDTIRYQPVSEFDVVTRDIALVVEESVTCGALVSEIRHACKQIKDVDLFDIYRGEQIGTGKKSMAFNISFVPTDKPFLPADIERFTKKILGNLKRKLGAEIR